MASTDFKGCDECHVVENDVVVTVFQVDDGLLVIGFQVLDVFLILCVHLLEIGLSAFLQFVAQCFQPVLELGLHLSDVLFHALADVAQLSGAFQFDSIHSHLLVEVNLPQLFFDFVLIVSEQFLLLLEPQFGLFQSSVMFGLLIT